MRIVPLVLFIAISILFRADIAVAANADTIRKPDLQAVYKQMAENPMLYQVTEPHVVEGQAAPLGSPCQMPPGTIFYDKPHELFMYCDGKTWKRFSDSRDN